MEQPQLAQPFKLDKMASDLSKETPVQSSTPTGHDDADHPKFAVPVDSEHKSKVIRIFSVAAPHMRSFHLAWFLFFLTFFATFAPAALIPAIRENLNLDKWQVGSAGVASVCGAVACRLFMGTALDAMGPRFGAAMTTLLFAPAVFCMSLVQDSAGFTAARLFIGCSLCMFVCCQFWVGSMFNVRIVGAANAIAAGWGNAGGGACNLLMPLIYQGITRYVPGFEAWRWAFFVPGGLYLVVGIIALLFGQDACDGDYRDLKKSGQMAKKGVVWSSIKCGLTNYRGWILALVYGYSFGVELTVDNIITGYLYDQFQMSLVTAGGLGGLFGLMNVFTRATGGMISDAVAVRFGMRGRLWVLYIIQTLGGAFCLIMCYVDHSLAGTITVMLIFSIFCQQACGAVYGITPFISRRAYGTVTGLVGAGGNVGSIVTQTIFFAGNKNSPNLTTQEGLRWMGVMTMGVTLAVFFLQWPMWGSMLTKGNDEYAEEDYYLQEWTAEEVAQGLHGGSMKFAMESRSMRGHRANPAGVLSAKAINATNGMGNNEHSTHGSVLVGMEPAVMPAGKA